MQKDIDKTVTQITINYAPVLIPTLCRAEHFIRCVESLKKNNWAKYTDIYVALDYPNQKSHWKGYKEICNYLDGKFDEFSGFYVIKRKENYGSIRNLRELRINVMKNYDYFIQTDDDAEFAPNFLEYMDKSLAHYENAPDIIGVTGYSYPLEWHVEHGCNMLKNNFIFSMWGTGFSTQKYRNLASEIKEDNFLRNAFGDKNYKKKMKGLPVARYIDFINANLDFRHHIAIDEVSDIAVSTYMFLKDKYSIFPVISKVRNWGFDGSGENCSNVRNMKLYNIDANNYQYYGQVIDENLHFELKPDESRICNYNMGIFNRFDKRNWKLLLKTKLKLCIYIIVGQHFYEKLWHIKNSK